MMLACTLSHSLNYIPSEVVKKSFRLTTRIRIIIFHFTQQVGRKELTTAAASERHTMGPGNGSEERREILCFE